MSSDRPVCAAELETFLATILHPRGHPWQITLTTLPGGLESAGVCHVTVRALQGPSRRRPHRLVLKRLPLAWSREARVYGDILAGRGREFAPALLGIELTPVECRLYLEAIRPVSTWPWPEYAAAEAVMRLLARLHESFRALPQGEWLNAWDYEAELAGRTAGLIARIDEISAAPDLRWLRGHLPALRRLEAVLPRLRAQLLQYLGQGPTLIHGDVHPGNVMIRRRGRGLRPVLLDWGRSRMGSPLEDVTSWLQSLGYWEPAAKRRHDSLLRSYFDARGASAALTRELRDACWLAAASNLLAGAILYHLGVAASGATVSNNRRAAALHAIRDGMRVIRRADACWR